MTHPGAFKPIDRRWNYPIFDRTIVSNGMQIGHGGDEETNFVVAELATTTVQRTKILLPSSPTPEDANDETATGEGAAVHFALLSNDYHHCCSLYPLFGSTR